MTPGELLTKIPISENSKGKDRWYTAACPFCIHLEDATVYSSDAAARISAKGKILAHIKSQHPEMVSEANAQKA